VFEFLLVELSHVFGVEFREFAERADPGVLGALLRGVFVGVVAAPGGLVGAVREDAFVAGRFTVFAVPLVAGVRPVFGFDGGGHRRRPRMVSRGMVISRSGWWGSELRIWSRSLRTRLRRRRAAISLGYQEKISARSRAVSCR